MSKTSRGMTPVLYATPVLGPSRKPIHPRRGRSLTFTQKGTLQTILTQFPRSLQKGGVRRAGDSVITGIEVGKARSETVSQPAALEKVSGARSCGLSGSAHCPGWRGRGLPKG